MDIVGAVLVLLAQLVISFGKGDGAKVISLPFSAIGSALLLVVAYQAGIVGFVALNLVWLFSSLIAWGVALQRYSAS